MYRHIHKIPQLRRTPWHVFVSITRRVFDVMYPNTFDRKIKFENSKISPEKNSNSKSLSPEEMCMFSLFPSLSILTSFLYWAQFCD